MKLETIKELHRHHAGIVAALRKEIEEATEQEQDNEASTKERVNEQRRAV